jgi:protein-S-isoprenylcysteine O-methyltransferase Ste14
MCPARQEELMARSVSNAPKQITWIIALVLYVVALLGAFGVVPQISGQITLWSWIIGFGLMLLATKVKGL